MVAAAALGNGPAPLVGYGGSAVLGYLLSVALLPAGGRASRSGAEASKVTLAPEPGEPLPRLVLAHSSAGD